jgi:hypothetical protein
VANLQALTSVIELCGMVDKRVKPPLLGAISYLLSLLSLSFSGTALTAVFPLTALLLPQSYAMPCAAPKASASADDGPSP